MLFRFLCLFRVLVLTTGHWDMTGSEVSTTTSTTSTTTTSGAETQHPASNSDQYVPPETGQVGDIGLNVTTNTLEEAPSPTEVPTSSASSENQISVVENVTEPVGDQPEEQDVEENLPGGGEEDTVDSESGDSDDDGKGDGDNGNDDEGNANFENYVSVGDDVDNTIDADGDDDVDSDGSVGNANNGVDGGENDDVYQNDDTYNGSDDKNRTSTQRVWGAARLPFRHPGLLRHERAVKKIMARGPKEPPKIKQRKVKYSRKNFYNYKSLKPKKVDNKCQCGDGSKAKSSRIVNGQEAKPNFFPWVVSIFYASFNIHFCGGAVISDKYILTAAHCADGLTASDMAVRLGDHNLDKDDIDTAFTLDVAKVIMHKDYNPDTTNMDIALLKLKGKIAFKKTVNVLPVCLTPPDIAYYWENVIVPGWGNLHEDADTTSPILQFVELTVLGMYDCRNDFELFPSEVSQYMLCAFRKDHDACQGDSGGPLLYFDKPTNKYIQIGIVSWGIGCARPEFPGVYTKLSKIVGWVYDNTKDSSYCQLSEPSNIKQGKRDKKKIQNKKKNKKKKNRKKIKKLRKKIVRDKKPTRTGIRKVGKPEQRGRRKGPARRGRKRTAPYKRQVVIREGKPKRNRGRR